MISRLWHTLAHFFDYKTDINVKFQSSSQQPGPFVVVVHRSNHSREVEDTFLSDILIPNLLALNVSFEVVGLPALFSNPRYKFLDWAEALLMTLGLERLRPSYLAVVTKILSKTPTHVIFNNVIPEVSLALPSRLRELGIKTNMWIHSARLQCANGVNFNGREECHRCLTQGSRWAVLQNCFPSWGERLIYSLIYRGQRVPRTISSGIDRFVAVSDFTARQIQNTLDVLRVTGSEITVMRHPREPAPPHSLTKHRPATLALIGQTKKIPAPFFAYVGPLTFEKGADRVVEAARKFSDKGFLLCGEGPLLEKLRSQAPPNIAFAGLVGKEEKDWVFQNTTALLIPSRIPETSPLVISESDAFGTPVIYPAGGGAEETAKILKRNGCAWEEFAGQTFEHTESAAAHEDAGFTNELKKILGMDRE